MQHNVLRDSSRAHSRMRRPLSVLTAAALLIPLAAAAGAQNFPSKPLRLIVPFPAGGPSDLYARHVAPPLAVALAQPITVENVAGGNGSVGTAMVAKSAPDGHTLLMISQAHTAMEPLAKERPYDLLRDFAPVAAINRVDLVVVVPASLQVRTLQDFIALAKARPRQLSYASSGPGSPYHMAGELFKLMSGVDLVHVPYKSAANARADLNAGQVHLMFDAIPTAREGIESGRLRALATTGSRRSPAMPDVPTVQEAAVRDYEAVLWTGIAAPARTPRPAVERLNAAVNQILQDGSLAKKWSQQGAVPTPMSVGDFAAFVTSDVEKWTQLVRRAAVRVD
jgi:tripartite-type tricarboxylate transporter receptor subunit TctC